MAQEHRQALLGQVLAGQEEVVVVQVGLVRRQERPLMEAAQARHLDRLETDRPALTIQVGEGAVEVAALVALNQEATAALVLSSLRFQMPVLQPSLAA